MEQNRVRIADIADALGLSTATVSNVIHGKTQKIFAFSDCPIHRCGQRAEGLMRLNVSLICGAWLSALFLLAVGGFPEQILGLYSDDGRILQADAAYFQIVTFAYLPMALSTVLSAWLRCKDHAAIPFLAILGAVAANTGLNSLLIFGKLGFVWITNSICGCWVCWCKARI